MFINLLLIALTDVSLLPELSVTSLQRRSQLAFTDRPAFSTVSVERQRRQDY
jgi:hypothetical protein